MATDIFQGGGAAQIAFVFDNVADSEGLVSAFRAGVEVHVLDAAQDGLAQIAAILEGRSNVEALHVVGHGSQGSLDLGTLTLDAGNIGTYSDVLGRIGNALAEDGDILLYGCNVADSALGAQFVGQIAQVTGADIAASIDLTGSAARGGDWTLEYRQGNVTTDGALNAEAVYNLDTLLDVTKDVTPTMNTQPGNFVPGFTLSTIEPVAGDPDNGVNGGIYLDSQKTSASFTVAADGFTVASFDLTGMTFLKPLNLQPEFTVTIVGNKAGGGTATAQLRSSGGTSTFAVTDMFDDMTGLTSFDVTMALTNGMQGAFAWDLTFDAFTVNNISLPPPGAPNLSAGSDLGISNTDNITSAAALAFSGTGPAGDSTSMARVFIDKNNNGSFDAGTDVSNTATLVNGTWAVGGLSTAGLSDGTYKAYATLTPSGGAASALSPALNFTLDRTAPTLAITSNRSTLKAGETATITFTFSEDPGATFTWNGSTGDLLVSGGTLGAISGSGLTRTATFTPTAGTNGGTASISVAAGSYTDAAGNAGGSGSTPSLSFDTLAPQVMSITRVGPETSNATSVQYTVVLDSNVNGIDASDFQLTGTNSTTGTVAGVTGSGTTYTVTATGISGDGTLRLDLKSNGTGIVDAAGNAAPGFTGGQTYTIDQSVPLLAAPIQIDDTALKIGETATVTFSFTEAVTGFTTADVSVPNGALSNLSSPDGGMTWTATLTPDDAVTDASNVLTLDYAGIADLAGNVGTGTANSANYAVDTVRPALASGITISDSKLAIGQTATVTFTFNKAVIGFDIADVTVPNGTLSQLASSDGGTTWTAILTPSGATSDATNTLTLNYAGISDLAGNAGFGIASSGNYEVDTVRPTLASSITISDTPLTSGDTATVAFTFTEAVTDFDAGDVSVPNGALSNLSSSDGGMTWTATLTPDDAVTDASNVLTLDYAGIADMAGNAGVGSVSSGNYAVNTTVPGLAQPIAISNPTLAIGASATVTFVFNEAVVGFTVEDVAVPHGTLSDLRTDDNITWTATLTPAANATSTGNVLTLDYTGIANTAGNVGVGSSDSIGYDVDTVRPTLALDIAISDTALISGETATVSFTFNEAVTGFAVANVDVPSGTLSGLGSSDGGKTWSAVFIPSANTSAATNIMTVSLAGVTDGAGNTGAGSATSPSYAVQTKPLATTTIDGVMVDRETLPVDPATGLASTVLTVPLITSNRPDNPSTPNSGLADIPLGLGLGNGPRTELLVSLPVGTGMWAEGPSMLLTNEQALLDLIRRIENQTASGSSAQPGMTGNGSSFLASLAPDTLLHSQTLVLSAAPGLSSPPTIFVSGSSTTPVGGGHNATAIGLIIDTTGLPTSSILQLNNVDFAAIVGAATVRDGDGRNFVTGDDASQNIVLGADDDTLHGGGGDDYVGSLGGNDWLYGDDGNDTVSGGEGNDWLFGGNGHDRLLGGARHDRLDGGAGNDTLKGEAGNDRITGGLGRDKMWGGSGRDVFDFNSAKESKVGSQRDIVYDFKSGQDRIDLRDIDANTRLKGNQKFAWTGSEAPFLSPKDGSAFLKAGFTGEAGELRYENGILMGDVNGDGRADFQIKIVGKFAHSDVIL
ncbi:Ig-like domain-containing protein [Microvirga sesbaniae]|uniref:Ig-like domain-containing protein n=1 Tax=Microvirga sesbaniae TaxID=681392 RepID=UPI0021C8D520|nr:Ig-like domain-containing protein [Microvirga sp. HBU67692]